MQNIHENVAPIVIIKKKKKTLASNLSIYLNICMYIRLQSLSKWEVRILKDNQGNNILQPTILDTLLELLDIWNGRLIN